MQQHQPQQHFARAEVEVTSSSAFTRRTNFSRVAGVGTGPQNVHS